MRVVNVFDVALEEGPGRDGFWHRGAPLGDALGAARIGAGLYEARAGTPIWPYHYHYPTEEWLYVLDGAPVLRDPAGRRALTAGDVVRFPAGHRGAHTLEGPGRFVIFSDLGAGPYVSVYPDSDKLSVSPGIEAGRLNSLLVVRDGAVDYWHGEGSGPAGPPAVTREPDDVPATVAVNVRELPVERDGGRGWAPLRPAIGGDRLDVAVVELQTGATLGPHRYDHGRELWLLALDGDTTIRHADGERTLSPGELACLPEGPAGARSVDNRGAATARALLLWTTGLPAVACYPETGEWVLRTAPDGDAIRLYER